MAKDSKIAWTHHTFNPWWGCTKVSQGCKHCYAETFSKRTGHDVWGPTAPRRFFQNESHWWEPMKWNAEARKSGESTRVFVGSMCDWAETHSNQETQKNMDMARERLAALVMASPSLTWLFLTKRIEDASKYLHQMFGERIPSNIWLGTTAENQEMYDQRIPVLAAIDEVTVRFVSVEPQIGPVSMFSNPSVTASSEMIDWVIVGGESGPGCRPFEVEWARSLLSECDEIGVSFFMKQLGGHPKKFDLLEELPEDLRVREFPFGPNEES